MKRIIALLFVLVLTFSSVVSVNAAGEQPLVLTNCDTSEFWSANSQGMDALETDSTNMTEGTGSVGATAINGKLNQIAYIPDAPIDISAYSYIEFDIYFSDITWFNDCGAVMMELTSSGTSDQESNRYMKKVMRHLFETGAIEDKTNWWHFVLELDDPQGTANGQLDKAKFNFFRFYSVDPITTTPDYTMRIDNIKFTNNPSNYTPMVDEEEDKKDTVNNTSSKAEVYVPKRSDPNAELTEQLKVILTVEAVLTGVAVIALVLVIVMVSIKLKKKGAKR